MGIKHFADCRLWIVFADVGLERFMFGVPRLPAMKPLVRNLLAVALSIVWLTGCSASTPTEGSPDSVFSDLPRLNGNAVVEFVVNGSPITVEVNGENAPITAGNFVDLVQKGVYDNVAFHRVVKDPEPFVVQGGDPQSKVIDVPDPRLGTGSYVDPATGAPRYIPLEITPKGDDQPVYGQTLQTAGIQAAPALPHTRGAVAMARSRDPNSASSQFYFALADVSFLDGQYAVFGYVSQGMDVVDGIQQGDRVQSVSVVSGLDNLELPE